MGSLSNLYISQSYQSLAHLGTNTSLVPGTMTQLQDGIGQSLNISFDGTNISSSGNIFAANITGSGGSSINTGSLVTTSSFNSYTSSTNARLSSIETTTASLNISVSALNTNSASQQISIDSLNAATASYATNTNLTNLSASLTVTDNFLQSQINALDASGSAASVAALNQFTSSQLTINSAIGASTSSLNSATASLFTSASLALVTASFDNGTRNLTFTKGNTTQFSVNIPDASGSAGNFVTTSSFNAYTQSNDQRVSSLEAATGSYATTGSNIFIGNQTLTGSLFISGNINMVNGADIVTHHVRAQGSNGLELQTSAGTIIVAMGQGGGTQAGFVGAVTANSISASTINGLGNPLTFSTSVDSRLDSLEGVSGSFVTTSSFNSYTSSNDAKVNSLISATGSFATTGSNSFIGNQTITGNLLVSGSNPIDVNVVGRVSITGPTSGETPRLFISSSDGAFTELSRNFNQFNTTNVNGGLDAYGQIYASTSSVAGQYIGVYDNPNFNTDVEVAILVTENGSSFNDWDNGIAFGYVPFMTIAPNLGNNPAPVMTRGLQVTGSTQVQNFTASLQQGFTYVGNASGITTTVATSSFGTPIPTGTISGSQQITALGFVSSSVTASSIITASVAGNVITFTEGDGTTFSLTVATGSGGGGAAFPFTGDAVITGSLTISGSSQLDLIITGGANITDNNGLAQLALNPNNFNVNTTLTAATPAQGVIYATTGSNASLTLGVYDAPFNTDVELNINVDTGSGIVFKDWDNVTAFDYIPFMSVAPNLGNNPAPVMTRGLNVTGGGNVATTGSNTFTGLNTFNNDIKIATSTPADSFSNISFKNNQSLSISTTSTALGGLTGSFQLQTMNTGSGGQASFQMTAEISGTIGELKVSNQAGTSSVGGFADTILFAKKQGFPNTPSTTFRVDATAIQLSGSIELNKGSNKTTDIVTVDGNGTTINNSLVTANSIIIATPQAKDSGGNPTNVCTVYDKTAGSFKIISSNAVTNVSVAYLIINPTT